MSVTRDHEPHPRRAQRQEQRGSEADADVRNRSLAVFHFERDVDRDSDPGAMRLLDRASELRNELADRTLVRWPRCSLADFTREAVALLTQASEDSLSQCIHRFADLHELPHP